MVVVKKILDYSIDFICEVIYNKIKSTIQYELKL